MLRHRPDHVIVGEIVAIRENQGGQCGIISDVNGTIAISLRDWSRNGEERRLFEVHILEDRFCQLKWQGIPYGLAHMNWPFPSLAHLAKGSDQIPHKSIKRTDVHFEDHK